MNFNDVRKNENKGFSLVELIVVIAIMAVMTAVLAPSLLQYVERSRAQKDDSAMGEVVNAIKLAMADQDVYDELLKWNVTANKSCYVDTANPTASADNTVMFKDMGTAGIDAADYFMFNDTLRVKDETVYAAAGNMRGVTITFNPAGKVITLSDADVNKHIADTTKQVKLHKMGGVDNMGVLYNKVRATIGNTIDLTSQTYGNSDYTVFIRMGSLGGNDPAKMDAIHVYGQWSGTNLNADGNGPNVAASAS